MITEPVTTTYVEYLYPGAFFPEDARAEVTGRDWETIARSAGQSVFAFRFYDVMSAVATIGDLTVTLRSCEVNASGWYYIDAVRFTAADVAALPGDRSILLDNMRGNGWAEVVRCRTGNFRPLEDGDVLVTSDGTLTHDR